MKKVLYSLFAAIVSLTMTTSCSEDEGNNPGSDSQPKATIFKYDAELPNNPDNDVRVRFGCNAQVKDLYYAAIPAAESEKMSEDALADYIMSKGQKVTTEADNYTGGSNYETTIKDLFGDYVIAALAVNGSQKTVSKTNFTGLIWKDVCNGTYYINEKIAPAIGMESADATLQKCENVENVYRFKDVFAPGYSIKFTITGIQDADQYGNFTTLNVAQTVTPFSYGSYGTVYCRDVATWQGNDSYTSSNQFYDYNEIYIWMQYFVGAGNLGYGFDYFIPSE